MKFLRSREVSVLIAADSTLKFFNQREMDGNPFTERSSLKKKYIYSSVFRNLLKTRQISVFLEVCGVSMGNDEHSS